MRTRAPLTDPPERIALIAITRAGAGMAARVADALPGATPYVGSRGQGAAGPAARPLGSDVSAAVARLFADHTGLVFFTAVGVAVRLVAPHLSDKRHDPAIVAVDDAGRFAISVLAGHLGGANALAERVAASLGAQAIVTTASEAHGLPALDILGREHDWRVENLAAARAASAALVNGEPVGLVQDTGETAWCHAVPADRLRRYERLDALAHAGVPGLVVTDRLIPPAYEADARRWLIYRPPSLALGVGASSGVTAAEIAELADRALLDAGCVWASVGGAATIDRKLTEPGIVAFARERGLPLRGFSAQRLAAVRVPNPSTIVARHVGTPSVSEAAAVLGAGGPLIVAKRKGARVTIAVARRAYVAD